MPIKQFTLKRTSGNNFTKRFHGTRTSSLHTNALFMQLNVGTGSELFLLPTSTALLNLPEDEIMLQRKNRTEVYEVCIAPFI